MPNPASSVSREIATLRRSLKAVDRCLRRLGPKLRRAVSRVKRSSQARAGRKLKLSPRRRAQLKLQGLYIGYIRQLRPKQKAEVRKLREKRGLRVAIGRARNLGRS